METNRTGATFSFKHTPKWRDRIEEATRAVTLARGEFSAWRDLATDLIGQRVTHGQRELFIREFIPAPPTGTATDRVLRNVEEAQGRLRALFATDTTASVAHTVYGLVQAAGEYLDHVRTARTWETRLGRTMIGSEPGKNRALKLAREVVKVDC